MQSRGPLPWPPLEEPDSEEDAWTSRARRCLVGGALGAGLGLAYGLVSQWINVAVLHGVPLLQPPYGPLGNTVLSCAVGALLGLVTAWPASAFVGTLAGCGAGAVLIGVTVLLSGKASSQMMAAKAALTAFSLLPFAAILVIPIGLLRWAIGKLEELRRDRAPAWKRVLFTLLLLLVAGVAGALALYPERGQVAVARMNTIVEAALAAADRSALPAEYRGESVQAIDVPGYPERAKGGYTLHWEKSELGRFAIPRPLENELGQSAVVARFENGWEFVCLFITPRADPRCAEVIQIPTDGEE
jgi:hypothetical protein